MSFQKSAAGFRRGLLASASVAMAGLGFATAAPAQPLVQQFINPSFGGNPFYSDHLLTIANIDRPAAPTPTPTPTPSEEELIASQLRARFLSQLSSDIIDRISAAQPGQSGEFNFGDQTIRYVRTATETRLTFINGRTGETSELVIPVTPSSGSPFGATVGASASAEQNLAGVVPTLGGSGANGTSSGSTQTASGTPPL